MRLFSFILALSLLFLGNACLEEFTPQLDEATESIVVEGNILQGNFGATVRMSRSFEFDRRDPKAIINATVGIRDDQGNESLLQHTVEGIYVSDTSELKGIPGRSYQFFAEVGPGVQLESDWMLMRGSAELENVLYNFEEIAGDRGPESGVQIYLDAFDPQSETDYYRWEYEETWEFRVPYPANGTWDSQTNTSEPIPFNLRPQTCWSKIISSNIRLGSTDGLVGDRISSYPLHFVSTRSNQLYIKYSILVKQYSISQETHEFWRRLRNVTEDLGTLFDPVPTKVTGNIRNTLQEDIPVLGFFSADGYKEKRLFIKRSDLPRVGIPSGFADCVYDTVPRSEVNSNIIEGKLFVEEVYGTFGSLIGFGVTQAKCADCTLSGDIEKPDFWD